MLTPIVLTPAYGRTYKNKDQLVKDWQAGKDFMIWNVANNYTYCSIRDLEELIYMTSTITLASRHGNVSAVVWTFGDPI